MTKNTMPMIIFAQRFALSFKVNERKTIIKATRSIIDMASNVAESFEMPSTCSVKPRSMMVKTILTTSTTIERSHNTEILALYKVRFSVTYHLFFLLCVIPMK